MINVLVVEDEPPILRGICNKIHRMDDHFKVIHTAYNGKDALDFLSHSTVDVIFTDINMPIMDGLELLERVKEHYPDIIVIILSGYQEFHYAQKAVRFGAYDYLIKPLEKEALKTLLSSLSKTLSFKKQKNIDKYLFDTIHEQALPLVPPDLTPPFYLITLCAGSFPSKRVGYLSHAREYWDKINLESIIRTHISAQGLFWIISGKTSSEKLIILSNITQLEFNTFSSYLHKALLTYNLPITQLESDSISSITHIKQYYKEDHQRLYKTILFSYSQIIKSNASLCFTDYALPSYIENKLKLILEQNNLTLLNKELLSLSQDWLKLKLTQLNLEAVLKQILLLCKKTKFISISLADIEFEIIEILSNTFTYELLIQHFYELIKQYHLSTTSPTLNDKSYMLTEIENFIKENLTESITNQMLSSHFGLVPGYISKLFKTHKGVSPSEYLLNLRIEKAKELLLGDESLLAKDIAQIIGYSDPLYFSRVFKKVTGVYPSEYRKKQEE